MEHSPLTANFKIYSASLFLIFGLISCTFENQKNININSESEKIRLENQIAFITYGSDPAAEKWYEYNEKGDLTRQGNSVDTIVFDYTYRQIIKRHLNKKNNWQSRIKYTADQYGKITESRCYDENDKEISQNKYQYNIEGYLIKNIEVVLSSQSKYTNEYIYADGNLKEVKTYSATGSLSSRYVYEYYYDKPNNVNLFMQQLSEDIFPNERLGRKNKNMVRQFSNIDLAGDTLSLLKYTYPDQEKKDILVQKQNDVLNEFETVITYHFKTSPK